MNDTCRQLHWAVQAVAGVGRSLLMRQPDDSHSNLAWSRTHRAFVNSNTLDDGTRGGLRLRDLTLLVIKDRGLIEDEFPLRGKTIDDAFGFFESRFGKCVRQPNAEEALPYAPPAMFDANADDLVKLDRLYDDADRVLNTYRSKRENTSEVRCWPHHFDIATLQTFDDGRTIGAGFLPGDAQIHEPYWYVTPNPYPENRDAFAPLPLGYWNKDPWFGAVLTGEHSREEVLRFLETASDAIEPVA